MHVKPTSLEAVLLAGGKSVRMGTDKCLIKWQGAPLWQRQLTTLAGLHPDRLLVSSPSRPAWAGEEIHWVADTLENGGPMSGLHAALTHAASPLVVALAVDLPRMNTKYLSTLLKHCTPEQGCVPHSEAGFEPLAAIYPTALAESAGAWLAAGHRDFQGWLESLCNEGFMREIQVGNAEKELFLNLNKPSDFDGTGHCK